MPRIRVAALPLRAINLRHCRAIENALGVWRHVAACCGIAATHTTCTHVRGDAIFAQPQLHTKVLAIVESASQPRGQSSNIWAQSPQAFVPWILLWVGFPIKILAAMPWYVHVLVLILVALRILIRLSPP